MKILALIIFSNSNIYDEMLSLQQSYIHNHVDIDAYFVSFNEEQNEQVIMKDNCIYVKGKESYTNILYKTVTALDYIDKMTTCKYDYVVRSNISTIIHLDNLYTYLSSIPKTDVYTGGTIETLRWLLQPYEISETRQTNRNDYYGLKYIQGTSIIMSYNVVEHILKMKESIEYDIVDDVKLGIIIRDYFPEIYKNIGNEMVAKVSYNTVEEDSVFIRNRRSERKMDIHQMRNIIHNINNVNNINIINNINSSYFEKTIHITNKNIDDKLHKVNEEWQILNPEYKIELYDNERCTKILYEHYGQKYCDIFNFIPDGPIKADFFRACIIYIYGGVYVDADIKPLIPLREYIQDDIDFMTCVSYNYHIQKDVFCYNPQMIIAKKYSSELLSVINSYEKLYDNREKCSYAYWEWSICKVFKKTYNYDLISDGDNIFINNNKKYLYIIEEILDKHNSETYTFENFLEHKEELMKNHNLKVYCKYKNKIVLENFANK